MKAWTILILLSWLGIGWRLYQVRRQFSTWALYFGGVWMLVGLTLLVEPSIDLLPMTVFWFSVGLLWFLMGLHQADDDRI